MLDVQDFPITHFAQQTERHRIARELHDNVVQSLTALVTDLEYFRTHRLPASGGAAPEVVEKLEVWQELARESLISMRQTLGGLRKQTDLDIDLEQSIQTLITELRNSGHTVTYECEEWFSLLSFEYTSNIYYILREALTNIGKHAQASHINVFLFSHEDYLHLSVGDDGVGMASLPSFRSRPDGYQHGLIGLRERAALLGGRLTIESAAGKGTRIDVEIPLP